MNNNGNAWKMKLAGAVTAAVVLASSQVVAHIQSSSANTKATEAVRISNEAVVTSTKALETSEQALENTRRAGDEAAAILRNIEEIKEQLRKVLVRQ